MNLTTTTDCCHPCPSPETTSIPGPPGLNGNNGAPGAAGSSAYTEVVTDGFDLIPAVGDDVTLEVLDSRWMATGQIVFIEFAGHFEVQSTPDDTHVILKNLGYPGNSAPGVAFVSQAKVSPAGLEGPQGDAGPATPGPAGPNGENAFTTTTANFTMPAASANATAQVSDSDWAAVGQIVFMEGAGYLKVISKPSGVQLELQNIDYPGNAASGATITNPKQVSPGGLQGPQGVQGDPGDPGSSGTLANLFSVNKNGTDQNIDPSSDTKLTFGTAAFNNGSVFNTVSGRFTAPANGIYNLAAQITFSNGAGNLIGLASVWFFRNGTTKIAECKRLLNFAGAYTEVLQLERLVSLNQNDYVEVFVRQEDDTVQPVSGDANLTWFEGYRA